PYLEDMNDVMNHLKTVGKGGDGLPPALQLTIRLKGTQNGMEEEIRYLASKKLQGPVLAKAADELALFAYRTAVLREVVHGHTVKKPTKGRQADWWEFASGMRDASVSLAEAAKKKDVDGVFNASTRLNSTCNQCHSTFR